MTHPHRDAGQALRRLAAGKIAATGRPIDAAQRQAAIDLLTDLYTCGLRHGISPGHWAAVTSLSHAVIDALQQRDLAGQGVVHRIDRRGPARRRSRNPVRGR